MGKKVGKEADFIFLSSKITVEADCSHKIKRHLFLERKAMTNLDSILKSSNITLPTEVPIVKAMVSPIALSIQTFDYMDMRSCTGVRVGP